MDKPGIALTFLLVLAMLWGSVGALAEAEAAPSLTDDPSLSVELGYAGTIAYLRTVPLTVMVDGGSRGVEGVVTLDLNRDPRYFDRYERKVTVAARSSQRFVIPIRLMMRQPEFNLKLVSDGETLAEASAKPLRELGNNAVLVGTLSPDPASLSYMNMNSQADQNASGELWTTIPLDERNFPADIELLDAFNILVIDGFDVRTLSSAQQDTLATWIEQGGIAIVGGGPSASICYPFFESMTGLSASGLTGATDVPRSLLMGIRFFLLGVAAQQPQPGADANLFANVPTPELMLNGVGGEAEPVIWGSQPLIYQRAVGKGAVVVATFEIGAKPLGQWGPMHTLWADLIAEVSALSRVYRERINFINNAGYGGYSYDSLSSMAQYQRVQSGKSAVPALALLAFYLLLAGTISYLVLKRLDRREWMWLSTPVLALVFAFSVRALGMRLQFDLPLGTTISQVSYNEKGESHVKLSGAITSNSMNPLTISTSMNCPLEPVNTNDGYYDFYDNTQTQKQPTKLKYRFLLGDEPALVLPNSESWTVHAFRMKSPKLDGGKIIGRAWMEDDGLHAEVLNESGQMLTQGALIGNVGFNRMRDLEPGQTGTAFLKETGETPQGLISAQAGLTPYAAASPMAPFASVAGGWDDPPDAGTDMEPDAESEDGEGSQDDSATEAEPAPTIEPTSDPLTTGYGGYRGGLMALPVDGELQIDSVGTYIDWECLMAIAHPDAKLNPNGDLEWADDDPDRDFLGSVYQELSNSVWNQYSDDNAAPILLHYVALMEQMPAPTVYVDGLLITRSRHRAFVDAALRFEPIGPTGVVCYLPGMLPPKHVLTALPDDPTAVRDADMEPTQSNTYYELESPNDFVFELPGDLDIEVESLELSATADGTMPKMALYNVQTKSWDELKTLFNRLKGDEVNKYLLGGRLYVRILPDPGAANLGMRGYKGNVSAPSMALKGRTK